MPRYSARRSGAPPRYGEPEDKSSRGVERAATVAAAALGLVGYLYALGGIVVWLRVQTARLSADGAIVAIDPKSLLAVGARVVAFELFLLLVISAIVTGLVTFATVYRGRQLGRLPHSRFDAVEAAWRDPGTLAGFIGPELALLLIAVGLSIEAPASLRHLLGIGGAVLGVLALAAMIFRVPPPDHVTNPSAWRIVLANLEEEIDLDGLRACAAILLIASAGVAIFLLPVLQGTILLAGTVMIYAGPIVTWPRTNDFGEFRRELLLSSGVWTAIAVGTAVALAWVATPPVDFTRAEVKALDGSKTLSGAYLNRSDSGVYLGICDSRRSSAGNLESRDAHIRLVPPEESAQLELGHGRYEFDPGGRPSIWQVAAGVVSDGSVATRDAPLNHAVRGEAATPCDSD